MTCSPSTWSRRPQSASEIPARRSDRFRPDGRVPGARRGSRSPGGDSRSRTPLRGGDVPDEHAEHLQRFRGGEAAPPATSRLGLERDDPRPPVRAGAAVVRTDRRGTPAASRVELRALETARRRARSPATPLWSATPYVALRFSNIMEPAEYERFPSFWGDATLRRWNLWGYVDARRKAAGSRSSPTWGRSTSSSPPRTPS